jgi:hypothetical protein
VIARVAMVTGTAEQIDRMERTLIEQTFPELERRGGYEGTLWLTDPANEKAILIGLWASEEAREASEHEWAEGTVPVSAKVGVGRELLGTFEVSSHGLSHAH